MDSIHSVDALDKGMIHVLSVTEWDWGNFTMLLKTTLNLKACELFLEFSIFLDWLWVSETVESKPANEGNYYIFIFNPKSNCTRNKYYIHFTYQEHKMYIYKISYPTQLMISWENMLKRFNKCYFSFYKAHITLIQKPNKDATWKLQSNIPG